MVVPRMQVWDGSGMTVLRMGVGLVLATTHRQCCSLQVSASDKPAVKPQEDGATAEEEAIDVEVNEVRE